MLKHIWRWLTNADAKRERAQRLQAALDANRQAEEQSDRHLYRDSYPYTQS